jgi:segregation and condensation protein B
MSYDPILLRRIIEGALLAAGEALTVERLLSLFDDNERPEKQEVIDALTALQSDTLGRGFELVEVASGWRFQVVQDLAYWVNRLWDEKPQKYSRALLETLSLIAYRQPITRSDIEEVRGVAVNTHIIKTLAEREWIKVVGHRDIPGRPSLYATTRQFLDYFGLKSLDELPLLSELKDIDGLNASLDLDDIAEEQEQIADALDADDGQDELAFDVPASEGEPASYDEPVDGDKLDTDAKNALDGADDVIGNHLAGADGPSKPPIRQEASSRSLFDDADSIAEALDSDRSDDES